MSRMTTAQKRTVAIRNMEMSNNVSSFNLSKLSKEERCAQLFKEAIYYTENLDELCRIIVNEIPKGMSFRLISKLYRIRTTKH